MRRLALTGAFLGVLAMAGVNPPGFPDFSAGEYSPAGLGPRQADANPDYPGAAMSRGITGGSATVSVFVDAQGQAKDFLVVKYTDKAFGAALLAQAQSMTFQPAKFKGVAVAGRCDLNHQFATDMAVMTPVDSSRVKGDEKTVYKPLSESKLDKALEFTALGLPMLPEGFTPPDEKPVKVFVTFFVDEEGHVRNPNVESASSPALIPGAIAAVQQWAFKPPQAKGKPVLVFTGRPVRFVPRGK